MNDDQWDLILAVNLTGTKNCVRAELQVMKEGASVVNATSIAAFRATTNGSAYGVSKAGIIALTKSVAREEGKRGIRINAIAPYANSFHFHLILLSHRSLAIHSRRLDKSHLF